jgi:hypothetical protein
MWVELQQCRDHTSVVAFKNGFNQDSEGFFSIRFLSLFLHHNDIITKTFRTMKNQALDIVEKSSVQSFFSEHKTLIFAVGGVVAGLAVASALGSERAKQMLNSLTSSLADISGKALGSYKDMIGPLLSKNPIQGV